MRIRKNEEEGNELFEEDILQLSKASDALAHPMRIKLYRHIFKENLERRRVRNKELVEFTGLSQATVSGHISKLCIGGLLEAKTEGSSTYYSVKLGGISRYIEGLRKI